MILSCSFMEKLVFCLMCVCAASFAQQPRENKVRLALPGVKGALELDPRPTSVQMQARGDGLATKMQALDRPDHLAAFAFLEKVGFPASADRCREEWWSRMRRGYESRHLTLNQFTESSKDNIARVEFLTEYGGAKGAKVVHAYLGARDLCAEVQLAKAQFVADDEKLFEGVLSSVHLLPDEPVVTTQEQPDSSGFTTQFPAVKYADFASAPNSNILDPAKAIPNVTEIGTPHLKIDRDDREGYSVVRLPKHGITLKVPFGWASKGGFATMERIDFFPAASVSEIRSAYLKPPAIDLGIKILDSSGLGAADFHSVLSKVQQFSSQGGKITTDIDERRHAFIIKQDKINNPGLSEPSSSYMLYMQSPEPGSHLWVEIDIRAPRADFQKYAGLLGLVYKDIQIRWPELEALTRITR